MISLNEITLFLKPEDIKDCTRMKKGASMHHINLFNAKQVIFNLVRMGKKAQRQPVSRRGGFLVDLLLAFILALPPVSSK